MNIKTNDFVINIGTVNGSGSQSANTILLKSLFRMGIPVGGKNVFPSNIQGLPTWFWIRANKNSYVSRRKEADIVVAMNPQTIYEDTKTLKSGGYFLYNSDIVFDSSKVRSDITLVGVPFKQLVDKATDSMKIKKLLINIIYVGVLAELLKIDVPILEATLEDQFGKKQSVVDVNKNAMHVGINYAKENLSQFNFNFKAEKMNLTANKILMDGNTASALGLIFGGATFASWYPITPSSSLVESFIKYAQKYRKNAEGKNNFAVVQAEDELASIAMVLGAGWAGARSFTATSGPGVSLMAEAAGYAYYAEIPSVIWDVQRVGPSTGMPTRTMQGDLTEAVYLSHGDTRHPVLLPGNIKECFEFGQISLDLAERLQQLVLVLSDLDLGMNLWMEDKIQYPTKSFDRGKVLSEKELTSLQKFERYADVDGDGIPQRTIPGTRHPLAPYFTRGSGHNIKAGYTENSSEYQVIVDRLSKKWEHTKKLVPNPVIDSTGNKIGIIAYGTTDGAMAEARHMLEQAGVKSDYMRIRAVPFTEQVENFIKNHEKIYVIDQNRDGQMYDLLKLDYTEYCSKMFSIRHYDGTPITAEAISEPILKFENKSQKKGV